MASETKSPTTGIAAGGAITQFSAVKPDGTVATAVTDRILGIAQDGAASGDRVALIPCAVSKARVNGSVALGAELMVKASGTGELVTATGTGSRPVARALETNSSGDAIIYVLVYAEQNYTLP